MEIILTILQALIILDPGDRFLRLVSEGGWESEVNNMKIVTIVGARPQFIKVAAVSREFVKHSSLKEVIVHTGQHFDHNMSEIFFDEMEIPKPSYNLGIHGKSHGAMTGQMLEKIEVVLIKENPDLVLVYGDTNSTLAGALAARKLNIKLAHVEAGLRSLNMTMPEEINRIVTDRISDLLFCPTENAVSNLKKEGYENFDCRLFNSGDVMYDTALYYSERADQKSSLIRNLGLKDFILCTLHRAENTDDLFRLRSIIDTLNTVNSEIPVVLPLHPRTKKIIEENTIRVAFRMIEPVGYLDMIQLTKNCALVMTDSGGLQKEAFFFDKYCITLRNETEWTELVDAGYNIPAGSDKEKIISSFQKLRNEKVGFTKKFFGNGDASAKIAKQILEL